MLNTLGVVQVPPASTLPGLKANRGFQGKTLLEWVVRRVTDCQWLEGVIVVAPAEDDAANLAGLVPPDVPLYLSMQTDALGQIADALTSYHAKGVVRVGIEQPFVDPELIDRLVTRATQHPTFDYIGYCSRSGKPAIQSSLGMFGEFFQTKALLVADREATLPDDRKHVTRYLYSRPDKFLVRMIPVPPELDRDDLRLRIEGVEDWEHVQQIVDALGDEHLDWQAIAGLLAQQPDLRRRMAAMNQSEK
jgi:spore coat polysaccharide biosynthesis protein SpsF (cytidylyltransferase family)